MNIAIPFDVEVRAKASSHYDADTIKRRLEVIAEDPDDSTERERQYLQSLLTKIQ